MHTTFHLNSVQNVNSDLLNAIKAAYKVFKQRGSIRQWRGEGTDQPVAHGS